MVDKKKVIEELTNLLNNDDIEIHQVTIDNHNEQIGGHTGFAEVALTGYKSIQIRLVNRKQHTEFIEKLQSKMS